MAVTPFTHRVRVRYAEVDAQGVVFNAHWLTYADDATTRFFEHLDYDTAAMWAHGADAAFDIMVRSTTLDFAGSAGFDDLRDRLEQAAGNGATGDRGAATTTAAPR